MFLSMKQSSWQASSPSEIKAATRLQGSVPGPRRYVLSMTRALKQALQAKQGWRLEAGFKGASTQVSRPEAYLEAGVKQGEAVEIVAKQVCVYDTKIKQASMQASRSPAL